MKISPQSSPPKTQYHFRRNEVWIRRGATTDLASPEEVVSLSRDGFEQKSQSKTVPPPQLPGGKLIRRLFFRGDANLAEITARRFLALFNDHGVAETQIQQFLPPITLDKLHRPEALMKTLTDDILSRAADLFKVRREWLDGVDDRIYDCWFCYKAPQRFLEELALVEQDYDFFPFRGLYTGRPLDWTEGRQQPLVPLMVEKVRDLGELEVCRHKICCDVWDWGNVPCRIQLKARARVMSENFGKVSPLYAVKPGSGASRIGIHQKRPKTGFPLRDLCSS